MAPGEGWNAEKMFNLYLHDYMMRKKMYKTAAILKQEADVPDHTVDSPHGFLQEWWSIFSAVYAKKQVETKQDKEDEARQAMQLEEIKHKLRQLPADPHQQVPKKSPPMGTNFDNILEQPAAIHSEIDPGYGLAKPNVSCPVGINSSSVSPQILEQMKHENRMGSVRAPPLDHMLSALQNGMFPTSGLQLAGSSSGTLAPVPPNGWPVNAPNNPQQIPILAAEQPRFPLVTSTTSGMQTSSPGNSADYSPPDPVLTNNDTKPNSDKIISQQDQPLRLPLRKPRKRRGPSNLRNGVSSMVVDASPGVENANSVLSPESDKADTPNVIAENKNQGINLEEFKCITSSKQALTCCHFSSDGKLLAFAGSEGKVFVWNVEACYSATTTEQHSLPVTDIRFRPNSSIFITSSLDKTVKVWDGTRPNKTFSDLSGNAGQVMSLDFHPANTDVLCSCDSNDEIRLWSFSNSTIVKTFKGGTKQVRFQPGTGKILAAASGNVINLYNADSSKLLISLKGHNNDVLSITWDSSGRYILSVSEESARVWSIMSGGDCIYQLTAHDKRFRSCAFHPGLQKHAIIGGHKSLELWSPFTSGETLSIAAHQGSVSALAQVGQTLMVASASEDSCVKLWK